MKNPTRPTAVFLFLGPTGVGKTELAKVLAEIVFGDESTLIKLDMSEYMEKHSVAKLIGSPPGYVGFEEGGQLTEKVRRQPYSLILLDEIEKAHPDVSNILLQLFDEGRLTDSKGRTVDFRNTIIIMTSNLGSELILGTIGRINSSVKTENKDASKEKNMVDTKLIKMKKDQNITQDKKDDEWKALLKDMDGLLKKSFRPEFLNRIDEVIIFKALVQSEVEKIIKLLTEKTARLLKAQNIDFEISDSSISELARIGFDPNYGARPMQRIIQRYIENPLSEKILSGEFGEGDKIRVELENNNFIFKK